MHVVYISKKHSFFISSVENLLNNRVDHLTEQEDYEVVVVVFVLRPR